MFTHYQTEGIILRTRKLKEADEIFTLFTKDFGRIDLTGRSIRKSSSKLKMNMSLFSHVEVEFIQGKSYNTLTDARLISSFSNTKKELSKLSLFYRISEITLLLVYGEEKDEGIFRLLLESFKIINKKELCKNKLKIFYCLFSFNLLYFLGYKMYIEKCAACGSFVDKSCYFNAKEGGIICHSCFEKNPAGIYLEDVESLKCFFENNNEDIFSQDAKLFINLLENYLAFIPEASFSFKKENI